MEKADISLEGCFSHSQYCLHWKLQFSVSCDLALLSQLSPTLLYLRMENDKQFCFVFKSVTYFICYSG